MNPPVSPERLQRALRTATDHLLGEIGPAGHWTGELSSSALSTATAVIALCQLVPEERSPGDVAAVERALQWLRVHQNSDGGWGDTTCSRSNISTTALVWAAFGSAKADHDASSTVALCVRWLQTTIGQFGADWTSHLAEAIRQRYGKDRTFSVPILMACVLSGRLGADGWKEIPALPFELAALPHRFYGALQLPVVSYAMPALIAIGQVIHHHAPTRNPVLRCVRNGLRQRTAKVLESLQPENGGFLEATPLTSFVLMSLAASAQAGSLTARRCAAFLRESVRQDGSWPIDTNLSTWVSTLSVNALHHQGGVLSWEQRAALKEWLLRQQYRQVHPYTKAAPGGWSWTDLPGGVPDADDTPGVLLALLALGPVDAPTLLAGELGTRWLLGLQNRDGGVPTFCRGWGTLPFDRSGADLTAHALRAWSAWLPQWTGALRKDVHAAIARGIAYLESVQRPDGTWVPLWFGNENHAQEENPTWGTARVLLALREVRDRGFAVSEEAIVRGTAALAALQQPEGGWSGGAAKGKPCSVEETGAALEALARTAHTASVDRGVLWLVERVESGAWKEAAPIGFYFARLWYFEQLYPQIAAVAGLGRVASALRSSSGES